MFALIRSSLLTALTASSLMLMPSAHAADPATPKAILWKVEKANTPPSWLFATVHSADPRVVEFRPAVDTALENAKYIGTEFYSDMNSAIEMAQAMLTEKPSLEAIIGKDQFAQLVPLLAARGYPAGATAKFHPWAAIMLLIAPRPAKDLFPMDDLLLKYATENNRQYFGIENVEQQLLPYQSLPQDKQLILLAGLIKNESTIEKAYSQNIDAYLKQDLDKIRPWQQIETLALDKKDRTWFNTWYSEMKTQRNQFIVERLTTPLSTGDSFFSVSAAQLPGQNGLLASLKSAGYTVTPIVDKKP